MVYPSSSALKEHAVWFIHPFVGDEGRVDAESIRGSLGDFSKVIYCPARYGARIAQAFSTTEDSIKVEAEELHQIPDRISRSNSCFTDGVGTISLEIAEEIWEQFTETRSKRSRRRLQTPSAYQIRLGGMKGMLCVDERLDGRVVCTRPSMSKFTAPDLTVEIASAFDRPMNMYLNRPLIMLLETLGVPLQPIMDLQREAVERTNAAARSLESAARLLEQHGLGTSFHMTSIFLNLHKLHADLESTRQDSEFISFLKRVLKFAVNHVLRDLKYKARIPVENAWTLVGVADEYDYLEPDEIYGKSFIRNRTFLITARMKKPMSALLTDGKNTSKGPS
jgi:RNA-dependent RNA polymerase